MEKERRQEERQRDLSFDRAAGPDLKGHRTVSPGTLYFFTGLSGAGKTTIGGEFYRRLKARNNAVVLLDGDQTRRVYNENTGYTDADRLHGALRTFRVCKLLTSQGIDVVCCSISMYEEARRWNRENIENYREIYIKVTEATLRRRNQKKLYTSGSKNVIGFGQPFDEPTTPDLIIENDGDDDVSGIVDDLFVRLLPDSIPSATEPDRAAGTQLSEKYAVVTGGTKGIGRAIAEKLLSNGIHVIVNYASDAKNAEAFRASAARYPGKLEIYKQELRSWESVQEFSRTIRHITPQLHYLVLNAGTTDRSSFQDITPENWQRVMDVNLNAPFYLVQSLAPDMVPNEGSILFTGSLLGICPHSVSLGYSVTKAAIHHLARSLVKEFSQSGITINAVAPGFVNTAWQKEKPEEIRRNIENRVALHRFAEPEEIAELCWQMLRNRYINGSVVEITGGYSYC